jgi:hypothetical protein
MPKDKRQKRYLHALDKNGMVMCNARDKEAALRSQTEGIATEDWEMVTCRKCMALLFKYNKALKQWNKQSP